MLLLSVCIRETKVVTVEDAAWYLEMHFQQQQQQQYFIYPRYI